MRIRIWILFVRNIHKYIRVFEYSLNSGHGSLVGNRSSPLLALPLGKIHPFFYEILTLFVIYKIPVDITSLLLGTGLCVQEKIPHFCRSIPPPFKLLLLLGGGDIVTSSHFFLSSLLQFKVLFWQLNICLIGHLLVYKTDSGHLKEETNIITANIV